MDIIFIMASASDSHYIKRINALQKAGYEVTAYGFERNINLTQNIPTFINILPLIENGNYIGRISTVYQAVKRVISKHGKNVIYYATTFDIAVVCFLSKVKYIYGISDLVHSNFTHFLRPMFLYLDRKLIANSVCTVLTSKGFLSYLKLPQKLLLKCIFVKNKLDTSFIKISRPNTKLYKQMSSISFGFAGNIRYFTVLRFAEIIGKQFPQYKFIFWGNGAPAILAKVQDLCNAYKNIIYMGPFSNPQDLPAVYQTIDIMACNYDTRTINERLAEPNKLYECIFFNKPLIVTENTHLSETVKDLNIGTSTDNSEINLINMINSLTPDLINQWGTNESRIELTAILEDYGPLYNVLENIQNEL